MTCRWVLAALAISVAARAQNASDPKIPYTKYSLKNGMTVILAEDHRLPLVSVNLWYDASPANEPPRRSGFAHLFEHMMFQGSKHVGDDQHIKILEENGVTLWNGTTDYDRTNYFETLPANKLALALWLESDRMGFLADALTQAKLDNQRDVVRNERRQSVENAPYQSSEEALVQALYPADHPYHGYVIGSHEDLEAATLDDVRAFHRQFYSPANATLAIAGDFTAAEARKLVERYFGPLAGGKRQPHREAAVPKPAAQRVEKPDAVSLPRVWFGWVTAPAFAPGDAEADLAAQILGGNRSSRLYKKLVHDRGLASEVKCQHQSLSLGSFFECWATGREGHGAAELERAMSEEFAALRAQPPSEAEMARARNTVFTKAVSQLEQLGGFGGKTDVLQTYQHYRNEPDGLAADFARYRAVTPSSLQAAVAAALDDAHRVTVVTVPKATRKERP